MLKKALYIFIWLSVMSGTAYAHALPAPCLAPYTCHTQRAVQDA